MSRNVTVLAISAGVLFAAGSVGAQQIWQTSGPPDGGLLQLIAHRHMHKSGHDMLGARIHQDGRHELEKHKGRSISVDTKHGKVVGMDGQDLRMKRVKSSSKMASLASGLSLAAFDGSFQLAQDDGYYGYCFDDGVEYDCYWYPASDVEDPSEDWAPYDPTY